MTNMRAEYLKDVKRVVVKVGTSTLAHESGLLNLKRIENLVRQLSDLSNRGLEVILVTSGAVGAGMGRLGLKERPKTIPEKQACAAVGQGILMHLYEKFFSEYGKIGAQILLTREDMNHRTRFLNARNVMFDLLTKGVIPIINENDTIVVEEIKFGDNDTLSAVVASLVEADLLILLSDIDGLYDSNPNSNPDAKLIPFVDKLNHDIEGFAGGVGSKVGTGGMVTKINAAKISIQSGIPMVICNGSQPSILMDVISGQEKGTLFKASENKLHSRKKWIGFASKANGKVYVDDGAAKALKEHQSSLLASGIHEIEGSFEEGDVISVVTLNCEEIARGIVNYSSKELQLIKRMHSHEFESVLGYKTYDEAIHRDNILVIDYAGGE